jgi:hypothetical protein
MLENPEPVAGAGSITWPAAEVGGEVHRDDTLERRRGANG